MCFKITNNVALRTRTGYKIVDKAWRQSHTYGGKRYYDGRIVRAEGHKTDFITALKQQSRAGIYVYLDKGEARELLRRASKWSAVELIKVTVHPRDFIASGTIQDYGKKQVATYRQVGVIGAIK